MRVMSSNHLQEERGIPYIFGEWTNLVKGGGKGY